MFEENTMKEKRLMALCFGLMFFIPVAFSVTGTKTLLLKLNNADAISVNLADVPQYWVQGDYLYLKTTTEVQKFNVGSVQEIVFAETAYSSSVKMENEAVVVFPSLATDHVYVKGEVAVNDVTVYAADGRPMPLVAESQADGIMVNVSAFPQGIYQILLGRQSYKFIKGITEKK